MSVWGQIKSQRVAANQSEPGLQNWYNFSYHSGFEIWIF